MKLNVQFITHQMFNEQIMVGVGNNSFPGMVRSNATAALIVDCLKKDTTFEAIVDTLYRKYDAPREVIAADVESVLNKLRSIGALDE